jgi:hypothetical protein
MKLFFLTISKLNPVFCRLRIWFVVVRIRVNCRQKFQHETASFTVKRRNNIFTMANLEMKGAKMKHYLTLPAPPPPCAICLF